MGAQTHAAPGRKHPQSWGLACCVGIDKGNTGTPSSRGPGGRAGRCGRKKRLKDAKRCKKGCGKRCAIFGGDFSTAPVLPEPLSKTRPPPAKYHVPARSYAFECLVPGVLKDSSRMGAQTHAAPARKHPQSWGSARCKGMDQGNTGTPSSTGPRARAGRCERKKTLKHAKTY